ncbi:MAG: hypothetical protein WDN25_17750 [Acetobacteraceae bacterium]
MVRPDAAGERLNRRRIPYGLDRLPRDPALRSVEAGAAPLRLNSEPVPMDAMPPATGDHAAKVAAAQAWLESQCGDYAPLRRQFIAAYLRFAAAEIVAHHAALADLVQPYDGLFAPEDFLWSALRPLPRGWAPAGATFLPADIVFWDGAQPVAVELGARDTDRQRALRTAGVEVLRIEPAAFGRLDAVLPERFRGFWQGVALPSSPFRRAIPPLPPLGEAAPAGQTVISST